MIDEKDPFENLGKEGDSETRSNFNTPLTDEERDRIKTLALKGLGVNAIAREVKRSKATVSRAIRSLKISKAITLTKANRLVGQKLDAAEQLRKINDKCNLLLDQFTIKNAQSAKEFGFILIAGCREIRKQLQLQLEIFQTLYNVEEVSRWQDEIMDILDEVAPEARERFYKRLQERRPV